MELLLISVILIVMVLQYNQLKKLIDWMRASEYEPTEEDVRRGTANRK